MSVMPPAATSLLALLLCFGNRAESAEGQPLPGGKAVLADQLTTAEPSVWTDSPVFAASKISVPADVSGKLIAGTPETLAIVVVPRSRCESLEVHVILPKDLSLAGGVAEKVFSNPTPDKPLSFDLPVNRSGNGPYRVTVGIKFKWSDGLGPAGFRDLVITAP
jgi:hypothetical protein